MKINLEIQNFKCGGFAQTILKRLLAIPEISHVKLTEVGAKVSFEYTDENSVEKVKKALHKIGYPVVGTENNTVTKVKSYMSCAVGKI